ncbi:hypothetical protein JW872_03230 [Candidatus Babeliales bacterium]|nr:hypothetical protein [Candidatus Babeliales bacterium]
MLFVRGIGILITPGAALLCVIQVNVKKMQKYLTMLCCLHHDGKKKGVHNETITFYNYTVFVF